MLRRIHPAAADGVGSKSSPRLAWITDPHFDHATLETWRCWAEELIALAPDALIVTGDISEDEDVAYQLEYLAETFERPIYFVLGNHDFYGKSIGSTRQGIIAVARDSEQLHYLTDEGPVFLSPEAVLIGDDGWGDASEGDYAGSTVRLSDFDRIADFRPDAPETWQAILQREGLASSERLAVKMAGLPEQARHVLIATHVPPFRQACWYEGHVTDDNWAPFFVCGQMGRVLQDAAKANPDRQFTVLCGHTHHDGDAVILPNLFVHTGYSRYGTLDIESLIEIDADGFQVPRAF
ncbi:metallophosphoesterase family protein [Allorhodopirellula solitaria]|uniref:Calcineurin-like phosphoesterase n=1 Tax=Allorhodopirellula solitaria TaxID=2527987 RepID=A0A5C5YB02_9BACT|nr:metallophosphoesterase [Allorhodopirellula solitaria]TWT72877.1 Calcineurin-like phosphoesterase [Allorhodopirellula solitaria]